MLGDHAKAPDRAEAEALAGRGRFLEAVELGAALNARSRDAALERALVSWRRQAFFERHAQRPVALDPWPSAYANPFPNLVGAIPEAPAAGLTTELLGGAIVHHGCLLVRGLLEDEDEARTTSAPAGRTVTAPQSQVSPATSMRGPSTSSKKAGGTS